MGTTKWVCCGGTMPHSRSMVEWRLSGLKQGLSLDKKMHAKYTEVVEDYLSKGHAQPVHSAVEKSGKRWYLPHQQVVL